MDGGRRCCCHRRKQGEEGVWAKPTAHQPTHPPTHASPRRDPRCDVDVRRELYSGVVLTGGTAGFSTLRDRLERELTELAPQMAKVKVRVCACVGGAHRPNPARTPARTSPAPRHPRAPLPPHTLTHPGPPAAAGGVPGQHGGAAVQRVDWGLDPRLVGDVPADVDEQRRVQGVWRGRHSQKSTLRACKL